MRVEQLGIGHLFEPELVPGLDKGSEVHGPRFVP
jgi:hypothetical protein